MNKEFEDILIHLEEHEKQEVKSKNIDSPEKLISLLLKRVNTKNVQQLAMLLKQSVLPSICPKTNNEIDQLFEKIENEDKELYESIKDFYDNAYKEKPEELKEFLSNLITKVKFISQSSNQNIFLVINDE